jgi:hypothetical protein
MALIETIIALALTYALLSIAASAIKEMLESIVQRRKKDFKGVIEGLLGVGGGEAFLNDARIQAINAFTTFKTPVLGLKSATLASADSKTNVQWPSYLESKTFAAVAMELLGQLSVTDSKLKGAVNNLTAVPAQQFALIEEIYKERMARVEGSFKRNAQYWLLGIGFGIAVATDADTLNIGRNLQNDSAARAALVKLADTVQKEEDLLKLCKTQDSSKKPADKDGKASGGPADRSSPPTAAASEPAAVNPASSASAEASKSSAAVTAEQAAAKTPETRAPKATAPAKGASAPVASAPEITLLECIKAQSPSVIGWSEDRKSQVTDSWLTIVSTLLGYLLTAVAISLGAPFWFDVIGKVSNIRSTLKPKETK